MKRPFAVIGSVVMALAYLLVSRDTTSTIAVFLAAVVSFLCVLLFKSLRKNKILITVLLTASAFSLFLFSMLYNFQNLSYHADKSVDIKATVCDIPSISDNSYTYTVKVNSVNGEHCNFKIKYITNTDTGFKKGDIVSGTVKTERPSADGDVMEYYLASKIYFTAFDSDGSMLKSTGERNFFYYCTGVAHDYFVNTTKQYLPGETGAVVNAMVIGDRSGLGDRMKDAFNYSGTSHLLVVSGLHLTLWAVGIITFINKFSCMRRFTAPLGFLFLFLYSALTGFGVSVIRAGMMVSGVLLGRLFHRGSDSLNSIGLAVTLILLANPFSVYSAGLWLSVLSTSGILIFSNKTYAFLENLSFIRPVANTFVMRKILEVLSVSIPVTVFTAPVFIIKFKMLPIAAFLSNFLMVGAAMLLMIISVAAFLLHCMGLHFVAETLYFAAGCISRYLQIFSQKIGMQKWSTVSVAHPYYKYFLSFAACVVIICFILKRATKARITKHLAALTAVLFTLVSLYCTYYDYTTSTFDVFSVRGELSLLINNGDSEALVSSNFRNINSSLGDALNSHNKKDIDTVAVIENTQYTLSGIGAVQNRFSVGKLLFCNDTPQIIGLNASYGIDSMTVGDDIVVTFISSSAVSVQYGEYKMMFIFSPKFENSFENTNKYDILVITENDYEKAACELSEYADKIITVRDGECVSLNEEKLCR